MSIDNVQQTTVTTALKGPFAGLVVNTRLIDKLTGYSVGDNELQWGEACFFQDPGKKLLKPTGTDGTGALGNRTTRNDYIDGFVMHYNTEDGQQPEKATVSILRKGVIWTDQVVGTITPGYLVYWDLSAGKLATAADGGAATGDITFYGLNFTGEESGSGAAKIYALEVNLPSYHVRK